MHRTTRQYELGIKQVISFKLLPVLRYCTLDQRVPMMLKVLYNLHGLWYSWKKEKDTELVSIDQGELMSKNRKLNGWWENTNEATVNRFFFFWGCSRAFYSCLFLFQLREVSWCLTFTTDMPMLCLQFSLLARCIMSPKTIHFK